MKIMIHLLEQIALKKVYEHTKKNDFEYKTFQNIRQRKQETTITKQC